MTLQVRQQYRNSKWKLMKRSDFLVWILQYNYPNLVFHWVVRVSCFSPHWPFPWRMTSLQINSSLSSAELVRIFPKETCSSGSKFWWTVVISFNDFWFYDLNSLWTLVAMKCWESWSNICLVCAVALPLWRVYYESFSSSFYSSPRDSCPEMRLISLNALYPPSSFIWAWDQQDRFLWRVPIYPGGVVGICIYPVNIHCGITCRLVHGRNAFEWVGQ